MNRYRLFLALSVASISPAAMADGTAGLDSMASGSVADRMYYSIGGGRLVTPPSSMRTPNGIGAGVQFNGLAMCSKLDMKATISNSINGVTEGVQTLWSEITNSLTGAVSGMPALILKRANPDLYDLLNNGVLQARLDFDKGQISCERMSERIADMSTQDEWQRVATAETLQDAIVTSGGDAVSSMRKAKQENGNKGLKWIGGETKGGRSQEPVQVTRDTMKAGYNILNSRAVTENAPVSESACTGGLCKAWSSPEQAAQFMQRVVGDQKIRTCENCESTETVAGVGLTPILQEEQEKIAKVLAEMVASRGPVTDAKLEEASGGSMRVTRQLVEALRQDPDQLLLVERLSGELALVRVLERAIWASRALLAGMHEPNIANVKEAGTANERSLQNLDREINLIKTELEVRQALANNTAVATLERMSGRRGDASPLDPIDPEADRVGDADKARSTNQ